MLRRAIHAFLEGHGLEEAAARERFLAERGSEGLSRMRTRPAGNSLGVTLSPAC